MCLAALASAALASDPAALLADAEELLGRDPAEAAARVEALAPTDPGQRIRRAVILARAALYRGDTQTAGSELDAVEPSLDRAPAEARARWLRTRATVGFALGRTDQALADARRALGLLAPDADPSQRAEGLAVALQVALGARRYAESLALASRLQAVLTERGVTSVVRLDARMILAALHLEFEDMERAAEDYRAAADIASGMNNPIGEADARFALVGILIDQARFDRAAAELDRLDDLYGQAADRYGLAMVQLERAFLAQRRNDHEVAVELAVRARERLDDLVVPMFARQAYLIEAEALLELGRPIAARDALAALDRTHPGLPERAARFELEARIAAALGEWQSAHDARRRQVLAERTDAEQRLSMAAERSRARLDFESARLRRAELEIELGLRDLEIEAARRNALWQRATLILALGLVAALGWLLWRQRRFGRELTELAMHDALTRLPNRRAFFEQGRRLTEAAERDDRPLTMLMIDLDHFKAINDRFGHEAGDRTLAEFAALLRSTARSGDLPARLGGEEFGLLLPATDGDGGMQVAERLLDALQRNTVVRFERRNDTRDAPLAVSLAASIGVAERAAGESLERLVRRADDALYRAKAHGRARAVCAEAE